LSMPEPLAVGVGPTLCPPSNAALCDELVIQLWVARQEPSGFVHWLFHGCDVALGAGLYRAARDGGFRPGPRPATPAVP
jgi:hypothetical protein